jgi:hypothetical protein
MSPSTDKAELTAKQVADISALADGTLDPARRDEVQAWIAGSPDLTALYDRERRVVAFLAVARSERAPASLRARIETSRSSPRVRTRRRLAFGGGVAAALAVVALALAFILPAGAPGAPSVSQAAALAQLGPAGPAPGPDPSAPGVNLGKSIGDLYFPDWTQSFGWRAVGQRTDTINGRQAVTVYYQWRQYRIAYTIVAAPALTVPPAKLRVLDGTALRTLRVNGHLVVTWRRQNHTCVLSGVGVPSSQLQTLAAWRSAQA